MPFDDNKNFHNAPPAELINHSLPKDYVDNLKQLHTKAEPVLKPLGNGIYAQVQGEHIVLMKDVGVKTNRIELTPESLINLMKFAQEVAENES